MTDEKNQEHGGGEDETSETGSAHAQSHGGDGERSEGGDPNAEEAEALGKALLTGPGTGAAPEDVLTQEALARRVAALGGDDALEALASDEEAKLAARRKAAKKKSGKGPGKSALETAASKRLGKIGTRAAPKRDAVMGDLDPLMDRTASLSKWLSDNARVVQIGALAVVVALAGGIGWISYQQKREDSASAGLTAAMADEQGRIGDPDKAEDPDHPAPGPVFKTIEARSDSAIAKYREVEAKYPGTGAAILSQLAEGGLLLDKRDAEGALAAFEHVRGSALAKADAEVRGRALEGIGLADELLAVLKPEQAPAAMDKALAIYKELENTVDVLGFHELAMYDQARVLQVKGDKDKAIEQLKTLHERLSKPGEGAPFPYLEEVADDRLRELDPTAVKPKAPSFGGTGGIPGMPDMSDGTPEQQAKMRQMMEQMMKQRAQGGGPK